MAFDAETYAAAVGQIKKSLEGAGSIQGKDGTTFTPSINDDGYLVWTNNGGLTNPDPIKIVYKDVIDDLTDVLKATDNTIIKYGEGTKEQALGYLDNPTTISAEWNNTRCYNFLFQDLVGDGPFNGGGITEILGYTYAGGLYGFQMAFKYNMRPRWRRNLNGTWCEWAELANLSDIDAINTQLSHYTYTVSLDSITVETIQQALLSYMTSSDADKMGFNVLNIVNKANSGRYMYLISGNGVNYFQAVEVTYYNTTMRMFKYRNGTWEVSSVGLQSDITALDTRVTTLENQQGSSSGSSGDLSTSMVNVKTGNLVCNSDNLLICDIVPLGSNLLSGVHCDGKLYATNGVQVFISDFTSTMRTLQVSNGPITQLAVSVSTSGNGEVYIWAINSNRELGSGIYNHNDTSNMQLTINLFTPDILAMCQYDDKIYALSGSGEVYTNNNSMNPQMVLRVELDMDISRINIVNGMLVAYGLDAMNIPRCAIYDLNTGEMLNPWIDDSEVRFTDVCYYQGGLIGYHYESCMFYRAECGNFYNPFVVSPENPITWRPFTLDVESVSNEYRLYGLGDYLIYATDMRAWVYNRKGTQYTLDSVSGLCDMIAINDGIYYIQQNGCHKISYETEELSLTEAFMRLTL